MAKPTDAEVSEYISGYYNSQDDVERFKIKSIGASPELNCIEAKVYTETTDTMDGEGGVLCETVTWTLSFNDDGDVEGSY